MQIKQCATGEPAKLGSQFATGIGSAVVDAAERGGTTRNPCWAAGCGTGAASAASRHHNTKRHRHSRAA
jgi:hypothetical protein